MPCEHEYKQDKPLNKIGHIHDHAACPACIECERMNKYYREKIAMHIQLNLDCLQSIRTYTQLVLFQSEEIMKQHQEREDKYV